MDSFSKRMGFTPIEKKMQIGSIDIDLKNRLWNGFKIHYWIKDPFIGVITPFRKDTPLGALVISLWQKFFKKSPKFLLSAKI